MLLGVGGDNDTIWGAWGADEGDKAWKIEWEKARWWRMIMMTKVEEVRRLMVMKMGCDDDDGMKMVMGDPADDGDWGGKRVIRVRIFEGETWRRLRSVRWWLKIARGQGPLLRKSKGEVVWVFIVKVIRVFSFFLAFSLGRLLPIF